MSNQGFSYFTPKDSGTMRIVAITSVDPTARKASGITRERTTIEINCRFPVGGMIVTPAVGEQWYVERQAMQYVLHSRLPANSAELLVEAQEGQVQVGSTGPLTLHGSEVQVGSSLRLGTTLYRDTQGSLERSVDDGENWEVALGSGETATGRVSSVAGKIGNVLLETIDIGGLDSALTEKADLIDGKVPDSQIRHRVFQYPDLASFPEEGEPNTLYLDSAEREVYGWVNGEYEPISNAEAAAEIILGTGATSTELSAFFGGFSRTGGTLLDQVINAISDLVGGDLSDVGGVLPGLGSLLGQIVEAITGVVGGNLQTLRDFFDGLFGDFNPLTKLGNLLQTIAKALTGIPGMALENLRKFFTNIRTFLGSIDFNGDGINLLDAARNFINSILHPTGIFSRLADLVQWLTGTIGGSLQKFFGNIRNFLGSIDFNGDGINLLDAATTFINSILNPTGILGRIVDLAQWLTGNALGSLQKFFGNIRKFLGNIDFFPDDFSIIEAAKSFINSILHPAGIFSRLSDLAQWLTGNITGNLQRFFTNIRTFLGNHNFLSDLFNVGDAADTFIGSILAPRNIFASLSSLATWITGVVGGGIQTFFTNVRSFFGNHDFLGGTFSPGGAANTFITTILAPANNTLKKFAQLVDNLIPDGQIPILEPGKIRDLILGLTGNVTGSIQMFFTNVRSFFGNHDFLGGGFTASGAATTFLNSVLGPANDTVGRFAKLVDNLIPDIQIPILEPGKIRDLILGLTGSAVGNIKIFFDNVRGFFGNHDFLGGAFTPGAAAATFLNSVLGPANDTVGRFAKLVNNLIPDGQIPLLEPGKIRDLILGLTGTSAGNIKIFFDNVRGFFGNHDFLSGAFTPGAAATTFLSSVLAPANETLGKFAKLVDNLIPDSQIPLLEPGKVRDLVLGLTGNALGDIQMFFGNFRKFLGNHDFLSEAFTATGAATTFLNSVLGPANDTLGKFAKLVDNLIPDAQIPTLEPGKIRDLVLGLTGSSLGNIQMFFTNVRKFFGNHDFLSETFTATGAGVTFLDSVLGPANETTKRFAKLVNNLIPDAQIPSLEIGKIDLLSGKLDERPVLLDLVNRITGATTGNLQTLRDFFSGLTSFTGSNGLVSQFTESLMGTADTLPRLKTFFSGFNAFDGNNTVVKQIADALSGSGIIGGTLDGVKDFFTNIRTFLGNIDFLTAPSTFTNTLGTRIDQFIASILKPRGIFAANSDIAGYLGGSVTGDVEKFFKNLSTMFSGSNLRTTDPTAFSGLNAGGAFLNNIFAQPAATVTSLLPGLTHEKVNGLPGLLNLKVTAQEVVENITGLIGGTLANLRGFFAGLPDVFNPGDARTSLVQQFVKQITGTAGVIGNIQTFFNNVRTFLGSYSFLSGSFNPSDAASLFLTSVLAPVNEQAKKFAPLGNGGLIEFRHLPELTVDKITDIATWVKKFTIDPLVATLTGITDKLDLGQLGIWARNLLGRGDPIPAENIFGQISATLLGIIPVSHIGNFSPNLLTQGSFDSSDTMEESSGWSWDQEQGYSTPGAAKTSITSATLRELYSNQTVPTVGGDRLNASAWIKTSAFAGTSVHTVSLGAPTSGSFRLTYNGQTTVALDRLASASTVQTELVRLMTTFPSLGITSATVSGANGGPYTISIGGSADRITGESSLVGGNFSVTSVCPISLSLIPYVDTVAQAPVVLGSTGAATSWERITGTSYTVPDNVTSVKVCLAVSAAATAGTVWWSDISLTKQGLLGQRLVDRLGDAWSNISNGLLGRSDSDVGVDDLFSVMAFLSSQANTALANGGAALVQLGSLFSNLLATPGRVIGNIAEVVVDGAARITDLLGGLWDSFTNAPEGITKTVSELLAKARALRNDANTALDNAGTGILRADGAQNTADDAQKLAVKNSAELTKLQATALPGNSSVSDHDNFDYNLANLSPTLWSTNSAVASSGYYRTDGSKAYWVDQGGSANTWVARFTRTATKTSYQIVTAVLDTPITESPILGSAECYLYLLGRVDSSLTNYVYARIGYNSISVWKKVGAARTQIANAVTRKSKAGDTIQFLCGTSGGGIMQFQVRVNNETVLTVTDSTTYGTLSVENATTNNFAGFGGYAAPRPGGGQSTPGAISIWSVSEAFPDPLLGSGGRWFGTTTTPANVTLSADFNTSQFFPTSWFSQQATKSSDISYESSTGRATVSVEGWYQVVVNASGTGSFGVGGGGQIRPAIFTGGTGLVGETAVQMGTPATANVNVGFNGVGGTFQVYLKPGQWVRPGYNSTWSTGTQSAKWNADSAGKITWFSLALVNRSYN